MSARYYRKTTQYHREWLVSAIANHQSDECLLWPYCTNLQGYGQLYFQGKRVLAHRLAFFLEHGHWPEPHGLHKCDTPLCFNPRHIFEGTAQDNHDDASKKLRLARKLTIEQVREIRATYVWQSSEFGILALSRAYGVSFSTIERIVNRTIWKVH
jgi:hypothetical protein